MTCSAFLAAQPPQRYQAADRRPSTPGSAADPWDVCSLLATGTLHKASGPHRVFTVSAMNLAAAAGGRVPE